MKKLLFIAAVVLVTMGLIVGFNVKDVKSVKQGNTSAQTDKNVSVATATDTGKVQSPENGKSKDAADKTDKSDKGDKTKDIEQNKPAPVTQTNENKPEAKRKIDPQKPMVALTFDDGPHPQYTMQILAALKKYKGAATFFVVGSRAESYKSAVKSIAANGSQIGNHTYDHKRLTKLSNKDIINEINNTSNVVNSIVNIKPDIIRPTYGSVNDNVKKIAGAPLILWSIDTQDWKTKNKKMTVNAVMGKVKDGDIVLMHDIYKPTADAAELIIKQLSDRGYQLVTIDELYTARGIKLINGKVYGNAHKKK